MTEGLDGKEEKADILINDQFQPRDNRWIPWITNIDTTQLSWHLITYAIRKLMYEHHTREHEFQHRKARNAPEKWYAVHCKSITSQCILFIRSTIHTFHNHCPMLLNNFVVFSGFLVFHFWRTFVKTYCQKLLMSLRR